MSDDLGPGSRVTLRARSTGLLSWDYLLSDAHGEPVAKLESAWVRRAGELILAGAPFTIGRVESALVLQGEGGVLAIATKPNPFFRRFEIGAGERRLTLKARSMLARTFDLLEAGERIAVVRPEGRSRQRLVSELPEEWPLELGVFLIWLVIVQWKSPTYLASDRRSESKVLLMRAADVMEASLVKIALEAEGIPVHLVGGGDAIGFGELPRDALNVEVWVPADRLEEARALRARKRVESSSDGSEDDSAQ